MGQAHFCHTKLPWPIPGLRVASLFLLSRLNKDTSASSSHKFRIEAFQGDARLIEAELPIDQAEFLIGALSPSGDFALKVSQVTDAPVG